MSIKNELERIITYHISSHSIALTK